MISIIYANRNRDAKRIEISLESLKNQSVKGFQVILVDFGSEDAIVSQLKELCNQYDFVKLYPLPVSQLLWNKSKALNYGILKAEGDFIFIADVDLVFHPEAVQLLNSYCNSQYFQLFQLAYLDEKESKKLNLSYNYKGLKSGRIGDVNGMVLANKEAFLKVNGFDEFFHFYGAEDEDLFARLENAGFKKEAFDHEYFYHNWHQSFSGSEDELLTGNPRVKNIMRLNQRHFKRNRERRIIKPLRQQGMGEIVSKEEGRLLENPNRKIKINNVLAQVEHFLREELPSYENEVIEAVFLEDPYYHSLKHKTKKLLNKQTQSYCSMKEVNDMLLKEILFLYRNHNYSFKISEDLKSITFCIKI